MNVACPTCQMHLRVRPEQMGRKVRCSRCQGILTVPIAEHSGEPSPEPAAVHDWRTDPPLPVAMQPNSSTLNLTDMQGPSSSTATRFPIIFHVAAWMVTIFLAVWGAAMLHSRYQTAKAVNDAEKVQKVQKERERQVEQERKELEERATREVEKEMQRERRNRK
jgi:predicted Zn finger-like uncharacterized protein